MRQILVWVRVLVVASGAVAFVVVDQILTPTRLTSCIRTVRNVLAEVNTPWRDLMCETAVAIATEVINVLTCGILMINALSVPVAQVLG
jgi:hypothetical protein